MRPGVQIRIDSKRGCGWRKPGGLYLVAEGLAMPCGRLPIPLETCPTCGHGIKPCRGWTWIDTAPLLDAHPCRPPQGASCSAHCPLSWPGRRAGLLWIGEVYYASAQQFAREADRIGVSRRISKLPAGFVLGQTWVWLAHRKTICEPCPGSCQGQPGDVGCARCQGSGVVYIPGAFRIFKPTAVEYVTTGYESDDELERLVDRDITPVRVVRDEATQASLLDLEPSEN